VTNFRLANPDLNFNWVIILHAILTFPMFEEQFLVNQTAPKLSEELFHTDVLQDDMYSLYESQEFCDLVLVSKDGHKINVHKFICVARCEYFASKIQRDTQLLQVNVAYLELTPIIEYLYTGNLHITLDSAFAILGASDYLGLTKVNHVVADFVALNIDQEGVCKIIMECKSGKYSFNTDYLMTKCTTFLEQHAPEVLAGDTWMSFDETFLIDLLQSDKICIEEPDLFHAIVKWGKYRLKDDKCLSDVVSNLLKVVRFPLLSADFLVSVVKPLGLISKQLYMEALEWNISPKDALMSQLQDTKSRGIYFRWIWDTKNVNYSYLKGGMTIKKTLARNHKKIICGNIGFANGVHYWEIVLDSVPGTGNGIQIGISTDKSKVSHSIDTTGKTVELQVVGSISLGEGDRVGILLDLIKGTIDYYLNGAIMGVTGTVGSGTYYPMVWMGEIGARITVRFPPVPSGE
jgi:hypothetical protein